MSESTNPSPEDRVKYRDRAKKNAKEADRHLQLADMMVDPDTADLAAQLASAHALVSIAYSQMAPPVRVRPQHCAAPLVVPR